MSQDKNPSSQIAIRFNQDLQLKGLAERTQLYSLLESCILEEGMLDIIRMSTSLFLAERLARTTRAGSKVEMTSLYQFEPLR